MTTREELIQGLQMMLREGERITSTFAPEDWQKVVHDEESDGWNRKQVYSHVTAIAEISPSLAPNLANVPEGGNAGEGVDINAMNAQLVAAKNELSETELMATFRTAHENLIEFIQGMPQDQLDAQTAFGNISGTVADVIDSLIILHGLSHIYSAGGSATS